MGESKKTVKIVLDNETYEIQIPENEKLYLELKNDGQQVLVDKKSYNNIYTNGFNRISYERERTIPEYDLGVNDHHSTIFETLNAKSDDFVLSIENESNDEENVQSNENDKKDSNVVKDDLNDVSDLSEFYNNYENNSDDSGEETKSKSEKPQMDLNNLFNRGTDEDEDDDEDDLAF